jgi:hypothetical protein
MPALWSNAFDDFFHRDVTLFLGEGLSFLFGQVPPTRSLEFRR